MASGESPFEFLPDSLILMIFHNLSLKSLCISGAVCTRWRKIANDPSLWRRVDLRDFPCNLKTVKGLMKAHFSNSLLTLKLQGFRHHSKSPVKWNRRVISNTLLEELTCRCPKINNFYLKCMNIQHFDGCKLMFTLTHLAIEGCMWTPRWLRGLQNQIPNLQVLNLSDTTRVDDLDMQDISAFHSLKKLYINLCYRTTDHGLKIVCDNLTQLQTLEFSKANCTDGAIYYITNSLPHLQVVNIAHCIKLSGKSIEHLMRKKNTLKWINVSFCTLTPHELEVLSQCREDVLVYRKSLQNNSCFRKVLIHS